MLQAGCHAGLVRALLKSGVYILDEVVWADSSKVSTADVAHTFACPYSGSGVCTISELSLVLHQLGLPGIHD